MKAEKISFEKVKAFAPIFLDYVNNSEKLTRFYNESPTIEGFGELIKKRNLSAKNREILVKSLNEQYEGHETSEQLERNLSLLKDEKTFTITTGHQLNIFTGPLYFVYKIATVINACKQLSNAYPDYNFVPVYWMASEDHDFEEISYFHLFGKKYSWDTDQTGPVGRFDTASIQNLLNEIPEKLTTFEKAYTEHSKLAQACRSYVNELFGKEGLVAIDGDSSELKALFSPMMEEEIISQKAKDLVEATNTQLVEAGYNSQAFSREINFFYLDGTNRGRIIEKDGAFTVKGSSVTFDGEAIKKEIREHPERFSPNVIMRPVYQEVILPNIGYVGGPAEVAYWLQLKEVFTHHATSFPILLPRNFGMVITRGIGRKINKLSLSNDELFLDKHELKERLLASLGDVHLLNSEKTSLESLYQLIREKATKIDQSLDGYVGSECTKAIKNIENIERKLKKAVENKNDIAMGQIDAVKDQLFPGNGLQERRDSFLNFYLNNPNFIDELLENFDPFDLSFHLLWEE